MSDTRMPTQKRSIEKRNKIIEKGFEIMCEKGFHNVSTPDIAEAANVSTGIIYQYFNDKKEIFIEGVKNYADNIMFPDFPILKNIKTTDTKILLKNLIDAYIKKHTISKKAHEELMAMSHLDDNIANILKVSEFDLTNKIVKILEENNIFPKGYSFEKCLVESIKCYHNEIAKYIEDNLLTAKYDIDNSKLVCFYNFDFFAENIKDDESLFASLCEFDYFLLVSILINESNVNNKLSLKIYNFQSNH